MSTATASPWSIPATSTEGGEYELPQGGTYPAVLIGLIDLGTHSFTYNNEQKESRKVFFVWELTNETDSKGQNFVVAQDYTWSLNKKAHLRPMIESWIKRGLADDEEFELISLLGKHCMLGIQEGETSKKKKFVEVSSVSALAKGFAATEPQYTPFAFHLSTLASSKADLNIPEWVPRLYGRTIEDEIRSSKEFQALPPF